jgi:polyvinyl alcohol dehydrogenase (cytochrome)
METTISTMNAKDMKIAWSVEAPGVTATPAIANGIAYWGDWGGNIHATKVADGTDLWPPKMIPGMETGYVNSPALSSKWVYFANRNGTLTAHDRNTGADIWMAKIDAGVMTYIWSSPIVVEADNVLIIGVAGQGTRDNGTPIASSMLQTFHGRVEGYDATTGTRLWAFETAPEGAGVSVWSSAAVDVERKLAFVGTGNNYYAPASMYCDSMLAIDYMTGELKWHEQFTPNDVWTVATAGGGGVDFDVGATPNLFTIDGRAAVGVGDKGGTYYVLDRDTGDRIWERRLTGGSSQGGVMAPAAVADGVVYVISNQGGSTVFALDAKTGNMGGMPLWTSPLSSSTFGGPAYANGVVFVGDQAGNMRGLDAQNGMQLWSARAPAGRGGGFAIVDGMLYTGFGFHFSESRREPLSGGLMAMSPTGTGPIAPTTEDPTGCMNQPVLGPDPTFTNIFQGIFCATDCKLCHGEGSTEAGLALVPKATGYTSLVGIAPSTTAECMNAATPRVQAGNPMGSLLYLKLANMQTCGTGMPPSAPDRITPAMLDRVREWIMAGAQNN